jgi:hypothetical protein
VRAVSIVSPKILGFLVVGMVTLLMERLSYVVLVGVGGEKCCSGFGWVK